MNEVEVKAYDELYQNIKKRERIESELEELKKRYAEVEAVYESKIKRMEEAHERDLEGVDQRK